MTPQEYVKYENEIYEQINALRKKVSDAREEAEKAKPPKNRRQATPEDITAGSIIWHEREEEYGDDYWNVVEEVLRPSDPFKAYCADDGCRYGLDGAYIGRTR